MRLFCVLAMMLLTAAVSAQPDGNTQRAPFTGVRYTESEAHIEIEGEWYVWQGIDGIAFRDLRAFAEKIAGEMWQSRLEEDLDWVLTEHGTPAGETVELLVSPIGGGEPRTLEAVRMTRQNRQLIKYKQTMAELERARLIREGKIDVEATFGELAETIRPYHAYASLRVDDLDAVIQDEVGKLGDRDDWGSVVLAAQRVVCRLGDGHARADNWNEALPDGYLPVLLQHAQGGIVAFNQDRSGFVDPARPYIVAIDSLPIEKWMSAASVYVTDGSPQLVQRRSLRMVRWINMVRDELGRPHVDSVKLTLADERNSKADVELSIASNRPIYGDWPKSQTRLLDSGVGYLRLASMQPSDELEDLADERDWEDEKLESVWMEEIHREIDRVDGAPALIIDVRGNGGGVREPTVALMQRIMAAGSEPVVINAARARISRVQDSGDSDGYLDNRMLYPEAWDGWSEEERNAIAHFRERFEPAWTPEGGSFSDWHYMVVSPSERSPQNPRPVVVLIDDGCFSATDIFAAAMGELPNVTLMGQATSGGSARSVGYDLEHLGVAVKLGTMVSYQPSGELYDGVGVQPDVEFERVATDLIGETDRVLEEAERYLLEGQK